MNSSLIEGYDYHVVAPAHHATLRCRFLMPRDFRVSRLPDENFDFARRAAFVPIVVALTPIGPLVFSVAARPAQADVVLAHWLELLCRTEGFQRGELRERNLGPLRGVTCDAIQHGQGVDMRMRLVLIEDGGRVFQITAMAPLNLWTIAENRFTPMLDSFELDQVRGPTVPLFPDRTW